MFEQAVWYDFNEHFPPLQILSYTYKKFVIYGCILLNHCVQMGKEKFIMHYFKLVSRNSRSYIQKFNIIIYKDISTGDCRVYRPI